MLYLDVKLRDKFQPEREIDKPPPQSHIHHLGYVLLLDIGELSGLSEYSCVQYNLINA